nr:unnamed protein product [Callosobruchus analis]
MEWLQLKTVEARKEYQKRRKEVQTETNKAKNEYWENACHQVNRNMGNTRANRAWKLIKPIRTNNKDVAKVNLINVDQWTQYYRELLTEDRIEFLNTTPNVSQEDVIHVI